MASGERLNQLRALVARLERLPASSRRDWMLQEARSRMVDVDTGDQPRPLRTIDAEPSARPPERPGSGVGTGRAVTRRSSKADPAGGPLRPAQREVAPEAPRPGPPPELAEPDGSPATFGPDELLWLGEPPGDPIADPDDGSTTLPQWRRGLRG